MPLTPRQWVAAVGVPTFTVVWSAGWLVWDLLTGTGWERVVFSTLLVAILVWQVWQWPRSLRSYRGLVASQRDLEASLDRLHETMVRLGWSQEAIETMDQVLNPPPLRARWPWRRPR